MLGFLPPPVSEQDWNIHFLIFSILYLLLYFGSYTRTLALLLSFSWKDNSYWGTTRQMCYPSKYAWSFQRRSGGKAAHDTMKWAVSAKNSGIRDRWWGDVSEREPPRRLVHYHKPLCPHIFCLLSQRLNHSVLHWLSSDQYLYSHNNINSNFYRYLVEEWGKAKGCMSWSFIYYIKKSVGEF